MQTVCVFIFVGLSLNKIMHAILFIYKCTNYLCFTVNTAYKTFVSIYLNRQKYLHFWNIYNIQQFLSKKLTRI